MRPVAYSQQYRFQSVNREGTNEVFWHAPRVFRQMSESQRENRGAFTPATSDPVNQCSGAASIYVRIEESSHVLVAHA